MLLHEKYAHLERTEDLLPLSLQIVRFKIMSLRRKNVRRGEYTQVSITDIQLPDLDADPVDAVARKELMERLTKAINGDSPFNEAPAIGDYLREHTAASDRVVIFGSEPEIFFYADRKSATGYIYMYPLMEHQPFAARMQKEMISEVERANPKYIVYVTSDYSWLAKPDSNRDVLAYADKKIDSGYRVDGVIDELPGGTVYTWGPDAERYQPKSRSVIFVFRRAA